MRILVAQGQSTERDHGSCFPSFFEEFISWCNRGGALSRAGWVWLVATIHLHEMIVGAAVVVLASLFLRLVHCSQPNVFQFYWRDVAQGWRIPWYMVCDTWIVTLVFFKRPFAFAPAGSYYRVCGFNAANATLRSWAAGFWLRYT